MIGTVQHHRPDHPNLPVHSLRCEALPCPARTPACLSWRDANARHPGRSAAEGRERVRIRIRGEKGIRGGRPFAVGA